MVVDLSHLKNPVVCCSCPLNKICSIQQCGHSLCFDTWSCLVVFLKGNTLQTKNNVGFEEMPDLQLLEIYGSKDCPKEVIDELIKRSNGRYCIVYEYEYVYEHYNSKFVDVENSLYMLRKAKHQETQDTFMVNGKNKKVYKVK